MDQHVEPDRLLAGDDVGDLVLQERLVLRRSKSRRRQRPRERSGSRPSGGKSRWSSSGGRQIQPLACSSARSARAGRARSASGGRSASRRRTVWLRRNGERPRHRRGAVGRQLGGDGGLPSFMARVSVTISASFCSAKASQGALRRQIVLQPDVVGDVQERAGGGDHQPLGGDMLLDAAEQIERGSEVVRPDVAPVDDAGRPAICPPGSHVAHEVEVLRPRTKSSPMPSTGRAASVG